MKTIEIVAPELHAGQAEIFHDPTKYRILVAGRRFGKSKLAALSCIECILAGGSAWWVSPTYNLSWKIGFKSMQQLLKPVIKAGFAKVNKSDLTIELVNGGSFQAKSADRPENLVGEGLDLIVIDECGIVHPDTWYESLLPALLDNKGRAILIGTPKGRNWFWKEYRSGFDPLNTDTKSWHFTSFDNPFITDEDIQKLAEKMPEQKYKQEILAEFLEDGGSVFRNVAAIATAQPAEPDKAHEYVMGVDWARSHDFTVLVVFDVTTNRMVYLDRFNQIDWTLQRGRLAALAERYNPRLIVAESNSIGEPNIEELRKLGLPVEGFQTTANTKPQLIDSLALVIERAEIELLQDDVLIYELQSYAMERMPSGYYRYGAPSGGHDDTVIATALAYHAATKPRGGVVTMHRSQPAPTRRRR